eukprot:6199954-Pleurochrysis_carterae.AAC.4
MAYDVPKLPTFLTCVPWLLATYFYTHCERARICARTVWAWMGRPSRKDAQQRVRTKKWPVLRADFWRGFQSLKRLPNSGTDGFLVNRVIPFKSPPNVLKSSSARGHELEARFDNVAFSQHCSHEMLNVRPCPSRIDNISTLLPALARPRVISLACFA